MTFNQAVSYVEQLLPEFDVVIKTSDNTEITISNFAEQNSTIKNWLSGVQEAIVNEDEEAIFLQSTLSHDELTFLLDNEASYFYPDYKTDDFVELSENSYTLEEKIAILINRQKV